MFVNVKVPVELVVVVATLEVPFSNVTEAPLTPRPVEALSTVPVMVVVPTPVLGMSARFTPKLSRLP